MATTQIDIAIHLTRPQDGQNIAVQDFTAPSQAEPFVVVSLGGPKLFLRNLGTIHALQEALDEAERLMAASQLAAALA